MKRVFLYFVLVTGLALALVAWGCSASKSSESFGGTGGSGAGQGNGNGNGNGVTSTGSNGEGGCLLNCDSTVTGSGGSSSGGGVIVITPANPALVVLNGVIPMQAMKATLAGQDVTSEVTWLYERPDIGDMTTSTFTPTGLVAGIGKLSASYNKASGDTNVSVTINKVINGAGLTPAQIAAFNSPSGPDPAMKLVYPFPETVFPLGVLAPDVQWNGAGASDLYKMTFTEKYYQYTEYFNTPLPAHHLVTEADWKSVEDSGVGPNTDPLQFALARMSGGTAYQAAAMTLHVAQGLLHGSVYYWELPDACGAANGRILRIKPDSIAVDQFFTSSDCYGCHTVTRDGTTMAAAFSTLTPFPQQTINLVANPVVLGSLQTPMGATGTFMAFNDKGDKLLSSNDSSGNQSGPAGDTLRILNAANGQVLNANAMGLGCGEPAWSPDGKRIAGICGLTGNGGGWIFDATGGHLSVADVAADGVTVSNVQQIVPLSPGTGRPAYPSFSPDSALIAFGRPTAGSRSTGPGNIWVVGADGTGVKQLTAASSGDNSYNPVFAPLRAGGFYWLVYISRRDYGNQLVGADAPLGRQQLWVTAIDDPPTAADPSHPPFYMRGQENCGKSENAYYALDPCKAVGQSCVSGIDCCNGQCVKDPMTNAYVCGTPPPPGMCSADGNACKVNADCCNSPTEQCIDGFCSVQPLK